MYMKNDIIIHKIFKIILQPFTALGKNLIVYVVD